MSDSKASMILFAAIQQKNIPRKIPLIMRIYDFANENIILSEKFEKSQFCCFDQTHIGVLYTKILMPNSNRD